jgi:hypothetical protein
MQFIVSIARRNIMATYHFSIKSGKRGKAQNHAVYIAREGKHSKDQIESDLIAKSSGNLPAWANDNPVEFWKAADKHERINGAAYRELEVALPSELTDEQNLKLVQELIKLEIQDKPYQFAIHAPKAALGEVDQPHAHIMFSDRLADGIERKPEQHFKRYNPRDPSRGGCKKDSGGKEKAVLKNELLTIRENWAELQNQALAEHGHDARVDHRSNKQRGITKPAERHLGQAGVKLMTAEDKARYVDERQSGSAML